MDGENSDGQVIYVALVTDVARLLVSEPGIGLSAEAVRVVRPHSGFVLATSPAQAARQASSTIALDAFAGDTIRFYAKSGSNNFEGAVLIEEIGPVGEGGILQNFVLLNEQRSVVTPQDPNRVFPAGFADRDFWFWQCAVAADGEMRCNVLLAVYDRDEQGRPRFAGHYRWVLQLTVNLISPAIPTKGDAS